MQPAEYEKARRLLMRRDPVLGAAVKRIGPCGLAARQRHDHLTALVGAIVSQQLSTKAAATIFGRFVALFPDGAIPGAAAIHALEDQALRGVGLSGQKVGYLRDLCARIGDERLRLDEAGRAAGRAGHRTSHRGERIRPLDGGDISDVQAAPARACRSGDLGIVRRSSGCAGLRKRPDRSGS